MTFDADAYAQGICSSAAGSSIETLVDTLRVLIEDGGALDDAIYYRGYDSDGDESEEESDVEQADRYGEIRKQLRELRDAIIAREQANGEPTTFD